MRLPGNAYHRHRHWQQETKSAPTAAALKVHCGFDFTVNCADSIWIWVYFSRSSIIIFFYYGYIRAYCVRILLARIANYRFEILNRYLLHSNIWDYLSLHLRLVARVSLKTLAHLSYSRWTYAFCLQVLLLVVVVVVAFCFPLFDIYSVERMISHFCSAIGLSVNVSMDWVFFLFLFLFRFSFNALWLFPHCWSSMCVSVHCCEWKKEIFTYVYLTKKNVANNSLNSVFLSNENVRSGSDEHVVFTVNPVYCLTNTNFLKRNFSNRVRRGLWLTNQKNKIEFNWQNKKKVETLDYERGARCGTVVRPRTNTIRENFPLTLFTFFFSRSFRFRLFSKPIDTVSFC